MNSDWHKRHILPKGSPLEQRIAWHLEHQKRCACRPVPPTCAEAVGFDPMPLETISCQAHGWFVRIGRKPQQAPTQGVVLVGFEEDRGGGRQFTAPVERAEWRKQPNRVAFNGRGTVEGTVTRKGDGWVTKTSPQGFDW